MLKSLQRKIICIIMVVVTVMLCIILGMVIFFTQRSLKQQGIEQMEEMMNDPVQILRSEEDDESALSSYVFVSVSRDGDISAVQSKYFNTPDEDSLYEILETALNSEEQTDIIKDYSLRYYRESVKSGYYVLFADASDEINTVRVLVIACIVIGCACLPLFAFLSFFLARWAVNPVRKAWDEQQQFVSDASHELKTPLTVIMTNAELLQKAQYDEDEQKKFSGSILVMAKQMRGLVESLLELARADNGSVRATFKNLDFSELVSEVLLPFEPVYFEKGLGLFDNISPDIHVNGSDSHLRQVVNVLLDNAQKYSKPSTAVTVTLRTQNKSHCFLSVSGYGDPISKEDREKIFLRFYRIDKARSRTGSYGLGLAIAKSIVTEHNGKIWAESQDGINTFNVTLPIKSG